MIAANQWINQQLVERLETYIPEMLRLGRSLQSIRGLATATPAAAKRPARVGPNIVLVDAVR